MLYDLMLPISNVHRYAEFNSQYGEDTHAIISPVIFQSKDDYVPDAMKH